MSAEEITLRSGLHSHPSSHRYLSPCKSPVPVVAATCNPSSAELSRDCKPHTRSAHADLHGVATMMALLPQPEVSYVRTIKQRSASDMQILQTCLRSQKTGAFLEKTIPWNPQVFSSVASGGGLSAPFFLCTSSEYSWYLCSWLLISCST